MKKSVPAESAADSIDAKIRKLGDWRGKLLARVRKIIREADPDVLEELKWLETPVWSHTGIVCTGEIYKSKVKLTFAKGASLPDPAGLFNSSLEGNTRRAIDLFKGDVVEEGAFRNLIFAAVKLNSKK